MNYMEAKTSLIYFIIVFNKQTNHMYSNMAIKISITEILTEELLMSVLVSSLSSLTLMKKSSPYWQLSTFMLIMSLIIDCMRRYKIVFVYQMVLLMMLFWFLLMFQVLPFTFSFRCHELHEITEEKFFLDAC